MSLEWVPAAEPEFVDSHEKKSYKIDLAQIRTSEKTHKFYQTYVYLES